MKAHWFHRWLPWLVWVSFLLLYIATAAPSIVELFDDSLEFQLVGPTFGIAHPTGYPLYILLGGLWSRLLFPFGNWAWRMNLFSALAAATAVAVVFHLAQRLVTQADGRPNPMAGLAAAAALGFSPIWWSQATVAEVYALHGLFVALILSVALGMNEGYAVTRFGQIGLQPPAPSPLPLAPCPLPFAQRMTLLCALLGLALTHHRTTVLLLPGLALYLLWSVPGLWRPRWIWWRWALALLAPLLLYLFIPLRASMGAVDLHGSYQNSWHGFWAHILATGYSQSFFHDNPLAKHYTASDWLQIVQSQVGAWGLLFGGVGLLWLVDRQKKPAKAWVCILLVLFTNLIFALNYKVSDVEVYLLPVILCLALFIGAGVGFLGRLWTERPLWANGFQAIVVLLLVAGIGGRGQMINRSQIWDAHDYAIALAKVNFPPHSRVIGLEGEITALNYMQQAAGLGLAAKGTAADEPQARRRAIAKAVAKGEPTYITRELNDIAARYSFSGEGPLVRVWPRGQAKVGAPQHPLALRLANDTLTLEGYDLDVLAEAGGPTLQVAFYWRPTTPLHQTLKLSLRLQHPDGAPVLWPDGRPATTDEFPLRQVAPSPTWVTGELVRDVHTLRLPPTTHGQPSQLQVILYDAESVAEMGRWQVEVHW
ncbi:MAG: DUF2723 domain-containing protein [Caldilineaceae bacterium]